MLFALSISYLIRFFVYDHDCHLIHCRPIFVLLKKKELLAVHFDIIIHDLSTAIISAMSSESHDN